MSDNDPDPGNTNSNISEKYFRECFQVCAHDTHIANVFYSPSKQEKSKSRIFEADHGYGGSPVEHCLREALAIAQDHGFDIMAIECVPLSATDGSAKILANMKLVDLRMAIFHAIKSQFVKKRLANSVYHAVLLHSLATRARNDLNNDSHLVRRAGDEYVCIQPYLMTAPGLHERKAVVMSRDPSGGLWKNFSARQNSEVRIILDNQCNIPACAAYFDIDAQLPPEWLGAFSDYNLFVRNVIKAIRQPDIDIFAGNEGFISKVSEKLGQKKKTIVMGGKDKQENQIINKAMFSKLEQIKPDVYKTFFVSGADHYFENKRAEYANIMCEVIYGMKDKVRC
ncbi:MAG: hypothetical protein LBJ73_02595 [Rickettsiales bacterium]|jgi:hypothetical protein|nr:hypothetical protein [Rickettsiales bacterium]